MGDHDLAPDASANDWPIMTTWVCIWCLAREPHREGERSIYGPCRDRRDHELRCETPLKVQAIRPDQHSP